FNDNKVSRSVADTMKHSVVVVDNCSKSRGSYRREWTYAEEAGDLPPIVEVLKKNQKQKDESFVSSRFEKIVNDYETKLDERVSQLSTKGSSVNSSGQFPVAECDQIYYELFSVNEAEADLVFSSWFRSVLMFVASLWRRFSDGLCFGLYFVESFSLVVEGFSTATRMFRVLIFG
ncbi:unnamed protein product, partial [Cochlearia groenlandica]